MCGDRCGTGWRSPPSLTVLAKTISSSHLRERYANSTGASLTRGMSQNNWNEQSPCKVKRSTVWIESSNRFIINEDTGKPEIVAVLRDITEKKALETQGKKM